MRMIQGARRVRRAEKPARGGSVLGGVVMVVLVAGCTSTAGESASGGSAGAGAASATPVPSPSFSCAPDGQRRACTPEELEYAEEFVAVKAQYEVFARELDEWLMAGAPVEETPDFKASATGEQVDAAHGSGEEYRQLGIRLEREVPADSVILKLATDDEVVIIACVDARQMQALDVTTGEVIGSGYRTATEVTARKIDSIWKLVSQRMVEWEPCA